MKLAVHTTIAVLCVLMAVGAIQGNQGSEKQDAVLDRVVQEVLGGQLDGKRIYIKPEILDAKVPVLSWNGRIFTTPSPGWLVFIDDYAQANFEHPCRYVFVEEGSQDLRVYEAMTPPADIEVFQEFETEMKRLYEGAREVRPVPYMGPIRSGGLRGRGGNNYAVLISGGASMGNNHIRYYNDMTFIYTTLKEVYSYKDDDIYVLMSDGTNPAADRSDGTNSPPDMDGDGADDIDFPAELWAVDSVFALLQSRVTEDDQIFFFFTDHGGSNGGWSVYLNLWNWQTMADSYFAGLVNSLPACQFIFTFEQCFSGGFEDDLQTLPPRVFSSAARYDEYSWAMSNLIYDEYVYYWISAVRWEDPYGNPVDADVNDDGMVTMDEAYVYAESHDAQPESPQYDENPTGLGATVTLNVPGGPYCGDANGDDEVTTGDGYYTLNYFGSDPQPVSCWAANVNGDGNLTPSDAYWLLNYLGSGSELDCQPCEFE